MFMQLTRAAANPAFRFVVKLDNRAAGAFTECTLPVIDWNPQEVKEGGLNTYTHQLPRPRQKTSLTLKNGVGNSLLTSWYLSTLNESFERRTVRIDLLDMKSKQPVATWIVEGALPAKWTGPSLKTDDNSLAIQTLEIIGNEVKVELAAPPAPPPPPGGNR